jgi:hypothetical protein
VQDDEKWGRGRGGASSSPGVKRNVYDFQSLRLSPITPWDSKLIERCLGLDVSPVASVRINAYPFGFVREMWLIVEGV